MARGHDSANRRASRDERERGPEREARPRPELRWVELRDPKRAVEIGRNGRIVASHYHEQWDAWEVLLETYEGELER